MAARSSNVEATLGLTPEQWMVMDYYDHEGEEEWANALQAKHSVRRLHTLMDNIEPKQTPTEAAGYAAGVGLSAFHAACRGKHISAAIIVLAGALLLLGGAFIGHADTQLFVMIVGCILVAFGLVGWFFSSTKS